MKIRFWGGGEGGGSSYPLHPAEAMGSSVSTGLGQLRAFVQAVFVSAVPQDLQFLCEAELAGSVSWHVGWRLVDDLPPQVRFFPQAFLPDEGRECSGVLHVSVFERLFVLVPSGLKVFSDTNVEFRVRTFYCSFVDYVLPNTVPLYISCGSQES